MDVHKILLAKDISWNMEYVPSESKFGGPMEVRSCGGTEARVSLICIVIVKHVLHIEYLVYMQCVHISYLYTYIYIYTPSICIIIHIIDTLPKSTGKLSMFFLKESPVNLCQRFLCRILGVYRRCNEFIVRKQRKATAPNGWFPHPVQSSNIIKHLDRRVKNSQNPKESKLKVKSLKRIA